MTEAEWLACTDPQRMTAFVGGVAEDPVATFLGRATAKELFQK